MGIGNRKKRSGRQIPRTIDRRHRRKENTGGTNTVSNQRWGFCRGQSPTGSRRSADGQSAWHVSGRQGLPTTLARDYFAFGFPIDGKCGALFEWQGWLLVWCGVVCARLRLDRGRSRFRVQGLERITYRAVYVLFLLPVSHQTYSQARAEPALIAADDIRSLRILLPKRPRLSSKYSIRLVSKTNRV